MQFASTVTAGDLDRANTLRERIRNRATALAQQGTILVLPTSPEIAPRIDASEAELDRLRARVMRVTCTSSLSGLPQVTIPIGIVSGCPAGLSFIGWAGGDEALLDLAVTVSRHCGLEG